MNKKGGLFLSLIILVAVFIVGAIVGSNVINTRVGELLNVVGFSPDGFEQGDILELCEGLRDEICSDFDSGSSPTGGITGSVVFEGGEELGGLNETVNETNISE